MSREDTASGPKRRRPADRWLGLPQDRIPLRSDEIPATGDDFEVRFYEDVLRKDPCEESSLIMLGHMYTRRGQYEKGLEIDRRLVRLRPQDPIAFYNLACSLSLLGRIDEAFEALEQAVAKGYREVDHLMSDSDLASLRRDPRFEPFCRRLRLLGSEPNRADS